jgi:subtilase family serine protease
MRKLLLISIALILVCQLSWGQAATPLQKTALQAQATGKGLPVVPASALKPYQSRPHVWIGGPLGTFSKPLGGMQPMLPAFCNTTHAYGLLLCPNALQTAYQTNNISFANGGAGMTIAIVDAFHYPFTEKDLNNFSADMGLPACTKASGCYRNLDQNGNDASTTQCGSDSGWELETMLDLEYAHAMAPNAKLILVEGCDNFDNNLYQAVVTASKLADVVSNSWGRGEDPADAGDNATFFSTTPILFSSGDSGAPPQYPCTSPNTTCIGGTNLTVDLVTLKRVTETGWAGSGGGCSAYQAIQPWQTNNGVTLCSPNVASPDIAAIGGDPSEVAVLDSLNSGNDHGYYRVWGTSLSCPVMAGLMADLDTARTTVVPTFLRKPKLQGAAGTQFLNTSLYLKYAGAPNGNPYVLYYYDVLTGNNGYAAGPGYDRVTGLGVLNGPYAGPPWNLP